MPEHGGDVDAAVPGCEWREAPGGFLELALTARPPAAACLVPGDDDVHQALEEVLLGRLGGAPGVLEGLVRGEVLAGAGELEAALEVSRERP